MAQNKYFSIPFNAGVRQDVPKSLLPLPFLTRAENIIIKDQGRLEDRPYFKKITQLPDDAGRPLKLFTYNKGLYCITDSYLLVYEKGLNRWKDISTNESRLTALGLVRNVSSVVYPLVQKERDIANLAFASFGQNLCFFYTYNPSPFNPGAIFYVVFSPEDERIIEPEKQIIPFNNDTPTGIFAYNNNEPSPELWIGIAYDAKFRAIRFNPVRSITHETFNNTTSGIKRFKMFKDRVFYTTDDTTINSFIFNPDATDKAGATDVTLSDLRDPAAHSRGFNNQVLYDFKDWTDFQYKGEDYKMVWSLETGYFLLNSNNRIAAHLYANLLPRDVTEPPRVRYAGNAVIDEKMVYIPVLRSGQEETVHRDAITDRILPNGRQQLVKIRPLGLELISFNMEADLAPATAQIGRQLMVSGPVLKWSGGVAVSEFNFTEKPTIEKTETPDYNRWPYAGITEAKQSIGELRASERQTFAVNFNRRNSPYCVDELKFTGIVQGNSVSSDWDAASTVAKRTLRYSSITDSQAIDEAYGGVLSSISYDVEEKALLVIYTSVPTTTLDIDKDHPQSIMVNNVHYQYDSIILRDTVLLCYHYTDDNFLTVGDTYTVIQPYANVLRVPSTTNAIAQIANSDNQNTEIRLNDVRVRRYEKVIQSQRLTESAGQLLSTASITFARLNLQNDYGAIKIGIAGHVNAPATLDGRILRGTGDVSLGTGDWNGGVSDEKTTWFINHTTGKGVAYNVEDNGSLTRVTDGTRDIDLSSAYTSGCSNGRVIWFINNTLNRAEVYTIVPGGRPVRATGANNTIALGSGQWTCCATNGDTVWFIDNLNESAIAYDIGSSNQLTRNRDKDLSEDNPPEHPGQGPAPKGGLVDNIINEFDGGNYRGAFIWGDNLMVLDNTANVIRGWNINTRFYNFARAINLGVGNFEGIVDSARKVFVVNNTSDTALVYDRQVSGQAFGTISGGTITNNIELAGIWTSADKLYLVFQSTAFLTGQQLATEVEAKIGAWTYKLGTNTYQTIRASISSSIKTYYQQGLSNWVRYEMSDFGAQALKNIILNESLRTGAGLNIDFHAPRSTIYPEDRTEITPQDISVIYSTFDLATDPKEVTVNDISKNISFSNQSADVTDYLFDETTFKKIRGPVGTYDYYSFVNKEESIDDTVLSFTEPSIRVIVTYPLVDTAPTPDPAQLLQANVYNYKTRFKWIDENGIEHRSPFSDDLQIVSTQQIGIDGNQPSFYVNYLNLTNKEPGSVIVEVYRTKNRATAFQLLTEIQSDETLQRATFTDDKEDNQLGAVAGNDNIYVSGAQNVVAYKGRFVLYGFPDKPNRILISSPENPFTNLAVAFQQNTPATPNDTIEILMEEDVRAVTVMDSYLIIFGERQTYTWALRSGTLIQDSPALVTGLSHYTVSSINSYVETTDGLLFNSDRGLGIQLLTRGLAWRFEGEAVKNITDKGDALACVRNNENVIYIKEPNTNDPDQPEVLVYNQRYKTWTSYDNRNLVSGVIWGGRFTALSRDNKVWQEVEEARPDAETFVIETGWLNLTQALIGYQRLRDFYLLAEFEGLTQLSVKLDYDFIDGHNLEYITYGQDVIGKKEFRFQPRNQGGTAIRLQFTITAKSAKLDALRFGGSWDRIAGTQTQRSSQRS